MTQKLKRIIWDWNGTLLDDAALGVRLVNGLLRERGLPEPSLKAHGYLFDFPVKDYYRRLGFDFSKEPFESISGKFIAAYLAEVSSCELREGVHSLLGTARDRGWRQVILSAARQDILEEQVNQRHLSSYFDELVGIDSVHAPGKQARGLEWLQESGYAGDAMLLIGDTLHDAEVAQALGVECWLVGGGYHPLDRLESSGCSCFDDLAAVGRALAKLPM